MPISRKEPEAIYVDFWAEDNDGNIRLMRVSSDDLAQFQASGYYPKNYQGAKARLMKRPDYKGPVTSKFLGSVRLI